MFRFKRGYYFIKKSLKLVLGISGASGVSLAKKFILYLPKNIELYVVISKNSLKVDLFENKKQDFKIYDNSEIESSISSGSFQVTTTAIIPCSMNTLAKISYGISDNLITRVASVAIKEKKILLLAPRELPFSSIALENMTRLSKLGVIISPPILGYYSKINSLEDIEKFIIGKWYDSLNIEHSLYKRWKL